MKYSFEDPTDACFPYEIEGSLQVDMMELFGKKSHNMIDESSSEDQRQAELEKELEEEAELVDELTVKYANLAPEQRERIEKLTYADEDGEDYDPFQTNYVDHQGVTQEESPRHKMRREKLEKIVAEAEVKGEEEGLVYGIIGVLIVAVIFFVYCRRKRLQQESDSLNPNNALYTGISVNN